MASCHFPWMGCPAAELVAAQVVTVALAAQPALPRNLLPLLQQDKTRARWLPLAPGIRLWPWSLQVVRWLVLWPLLLPVGGVRATVRHAQGPALSHCWGHPKGKTGGCLQQLQGPADPVAEVVAAAVATRAAVVEVTAAAAAPAVVANAAGVEAVGHHCCCLPPLLQWSQQRGRCCCRCRLRH